MKRQASDEMRIIWLESKKALASPTILVLLALFIGFNIWTVLGERYMQEELKTVNEIIQEYGRTFDDSTLQLMLEDLEHEVHSEWGEQDITDFFEGMTFERFEALSESEKESVLCIDLMYSYYATAAQLENRYLEKVDFDEMEAEVLSKSSEGGLAAGLMELQFYEWRDRYEEIIDTSEYKQWFFLSDYRMHSLLFRTLMKNIGLQGVLLIALAVALIANYEREHRTAHVVYTTKTGRRLILHKWYASLLVSVVLLIPLFLLSLAAYFIVFDYSAVWNTVISSGLNWEYRLPHITWWPVRVSEYFLLVIVILFAALIGVVMLVFAISMYTKNSYIAWIISIAFMIGLYLIPAFTGSGHYTLIDMLANMNITAILMNPHMYFTGATTYYGLRFFEVITLTLWIVLTLALSRMTIRQFNRMDVT